MTTKHIAEEKLVFIGTNWWEEYYLNLKDDTIRWWSFMGLRPETEDTLRERQRETSINDIFNVPEEINRWIDHEAFADDMEEDRYESHDVQAEVDRDWETYYLWFWSWQDIYGYFDRNNIKTHEDYTSHFDEGWLTEDQFAELQNIMEKYKSYSPLWDDSKLWEEKQAVENRAEKNKFFW